MTASGTALMNLFAPATPATMAEAKMKYAGCAPILACMKSSLMSSEALISAAHAALVPAIEAYGAGADVALIEQDGALEVALDRLILTGDDLNTYMLLFSNWNENAQSGELNSIKESPTMPPGVVAYLLSLPIAA